MSTSERYLFLLIGVVLFVYLLLRASLVPIVGDEAATFFHYIFPKEFIPGIARRGANNHLLNSIIATELSSIFGYSAFVLRLGNLLSFPLYLFFIYKFIGELKNIILRWILFFGLSTAVLIEFFALCRGYGMSFAFLLGSCWFLYSASRNSKPHFFFLSSLFILFGVAANMTLINTAIIVVGLSTILLVINYGQSKSRKLLLWAGLTIVLGITGISYFSSIALKLHGSGLLYLGNKTNFWDTTLNSIGQSLTHSAFIFRWVFLGLCIFIIIERGVAIWKSAKASALLSPTTLLTTLFFGNIIATILLTTLFEVNYPIARAGFYFFILLVLASCFSLDKISKNIRYAVVLAIPFAYFPIHLCLSVNLTHTSAWPHECLPEKFYNRIAQENPNATINGNKLHRYSWGYMNLLQKQNLNHWQDRDYPSSIADYRIINLSDISVDSLYTTIDSDEQSQLVLQRKTIKSSFKPIRITKSEAITSRKNSYHKMLSLELDTISKNKSYLCEYSVDLSSDKFPFICWLVVDVKNFEGKAISYDYVKLHWNHLEPVHNLLDERNTQRLVNIYGLCCEFTTVKKGVLQYGKPKELPE